MTCTLRSNRLGGEVVALKSMQLEAVGGGDDGIPLEMVREMSIMMSIRHPNIVHVKEAVVDAGSMCAPLPPALTPGRLGRARGTSLSAAPPTQPV